MAQKQNQMNLLEKLNRIEEETMSNEEAYAAWGTTEEEHVAKMLDFIHKENRKAKAKLSQAASKEAAKAEFARLHAILTKRLERMSNDSKGNKDNTPKSFAQKRAFGRSASLGYKERMEQRIQRLKQADQRIRAQRKTTPPVAGLAQSPESDTTPKFIPKGSNEDRSIIHGRINSRIRRRRRRN